MRRGKEFYSKQYEEALKLHKEGKGISEIATKLNLSYSAAYHWLKGLRKPDIGNVNTFERFLVENGPQPTEEIKDRFPKHNEIFLIASSRGLPVKRLIISKTSKKLKGYSVWYFIEGQEEQLEKRVSEMLGKIKEIKDKLRELITGV